MTTMTWILTSLVVLAIVVLVWGGCSQRATPQTRTSGHPSLPAGQAARADRGQAGRRAALGGGAPVDGRAARQPRRVRRRGAGKPRCLARAQRPRARLGVAPPARPGPGPFAGRGP